MFTTDTIIFTVKVSGCVLVTAAIIGVSKPLQRMVHGAVKFLFPGIDKWGAL